MLPQHAQAPPTRTGSERLWAQEQPWAMRQPWAPSKDGRGVALLTPCSDPRPGDPRAYAPSCCKCWLLLAPSTETLSGDSPWLKTAALPKPTPLFGAADIQGRQSPPDSQPRAPLRFNAGGPGLCWSSWRVALAAATVLHRRATAPSANRCRPRARALIFRLPRPRLRTGSGGQNLPQGLRDVSSNWMCLTVGPGLHVFPSKTE